MRSPRESAASPSRDPVRREMHRNVALLSEKEKMAELFPTSAGSLWPVPGPALGPLCTSGVSWERHPCAVCPGPPGRYSLPRPLPHAGTQVGAENKSQSGNSQGPRKANSGVFLRRGQEQDGNIFRTPGRRGIQRHGKVTQRMCLNVSLHCCRETSGGARKPGLSSRSGSDEVNDPGDPGRPSASRTRSSPMRGLVLHSTCRPQTACKRTNRDQGGQTHQTQNFTQSFQ